MSSTGAIRFVAGVIEEKSDREILLKRIIALESKVQALELTLKVGEVNPYEDSEDSEDSEEVIDNWYYR